MGATVLYSRPCAGVAADADHGLEYKTVAPDPVVH